MRAYRCCSLVAAAAGVAALAACSSGGGGQAKSSTPVSSSSVQQSAETGSSSDTIGVSPGGVTTRVDVPAESMEEQYAQACVAAKTWMEAKGGDPKTLVEPFLKELQSTAGPGPATFNTTWGQLSTAQQAAVIIAVRAATEGGC